MTEMLLKLESRTWMTSHTRQRSPTRMKIKRDRKLRMIDTVTIVIKKGRPYRTVTLALSVTSKIIVEVAIGLMIHETMEEVAIDLTISVIASLISVIVITEVGSASTIGVIAMVEVGIALTINTIVTDATMAEPKTNAIVMVGVETALMISVIIMVEAAIALTTTGITIVAVVITLSILMITDTERKITKIN